jgi:inorganic pyrophosphatase
MSSSNLYFLPSGSVEEFNVVIEIPQGSQNKYELDPETGALFLDRVLYGAAFYPLDYGFIPSTKAEDGDAMDVMIFMTNTVPPTTVVKCRAVGIIKMEDSGDIDSKILAVPISDPHFADLHDLEDVPQHSIKEICDFFENMQKFKKGQWVKNVNKVLSVENKASADEEIKKHLNNYTQQS